MIAYKMLKIDAIDFRGKRIFVNLNISKTYPPDKLLRSMATQLYYLYKNTYNNNCTCKTYVNYIIQYNTRKTQLNDKCYLDQIFNLE